MYHCKSLKIQIYAKIRNGYDFYFSDYFPRKTIFVLFDYYNTLFMLGHID